MRILFLLVLWVGCGGGDEDVIPADCAGTSCQCHADEVCALDGTPCEGNSCSLDCAGTSLCLGECGSSCSVECRDGADCRITVGASSSVNCAPGSDCEIRCLETCNLSCAPGAACALACGTSGFAPVEGAVQCE